MIQIATAVYILLILGLFVLDSDQKVKNSKALWLPLVWVLLVGSRPVSVWLQTGPAVSPEQQPVQGNPRSVYLALLARPVISQEQQYMDGSPLDRNVYLALLITGAIVLFSRRTSVLRLLRANGPILLFVLYCAISVSWSDYPDVALRRWIKSLGDYVMILIVLTDRDWLGAVKRVLARAGFVLLPLSILFIKYYPALGRAYAAHWEGTQYYVGVAENKNMLGMTCLVFGLAASWRILQELSGSRRARIFIVHGAVLGMALWLFRMANSITSVSCFLLASSLIAAISFLKVTRKHWVVHLLVGSMLLVCFAPLFLNLGSGVLETMGRNSTLTGRTEIWGQLLKVSVNPMVGTGFESFWLGKRLDQLWAIPGVTGINEAHNGYLEMYLNLGSVGITLVAIIMWTSYRNIIRLLNRDPEVGKLRLAYFFAAAAYCFTEAGFRMMSPVWLSFLLAAISIPSTRVRQRSLVAAGAIDTRKSEAPVFIAKSR